MLMMWVLTVVTTLLLSSRKFYSLRLCQIFPGQGDILSVVLNWYDAPSYVSDNVQHHELSTFT